MKTDKPFLIVKNSDREGPGLLEDILVRKHIPYHVIELARQQKIPSPAAYQAMVVLGGPQSPDNGTFEMANERARIREAVSLGVPYLGIGLGMHTLVREMGGDVYGLAHNEAGWKNQQGELYTVKLTRNGRRDPIFEEVVQHFHAFQLRGEAVKLGPEMTLLGESETGLIQAVRIGEGAYGFQFHIELTERMLMDWARNDPDLRRLGEISLMQGYNEYGIPMRADGEKILSNFVAISQQYQKERRHHERVQNHN